MYFVKKYLEAYPLDTQIKLSYLRLNKCRFAKSSVDFAHFKNFSLFSIRLAII